MTDTAVKTRAVGSTVRLLSILVIVAGVIMLIGGAATWFTVQSQLADERITVSDDADWFAGEKIDGPLTAYAEAEVIEKHSLEASGGKTYAELDREDPTRQTVMTGSFLRSSLFTSVVSFGIAAMVMGLGVVLALIGYSLLSLSRRIDALPTASSTS
ncbi:aromatic ring-opening dioxygenase LigA [Micromonospora sp. NPDC048170]|uniref:aromatic ring-opening dioxygenase LigA n=1 Tax=Micromonospora sp. NPDC048170 TaxID=3154819 RepID=UPI0034043CB0